MAVLYAGTSRANLVDPDVIPVAEANNAFAIDYYHELMSQEGNLIFSPLSLSVSMAYGSRGSRGENGGGKIRAVFHWSGTWAPLQVGFRRSLRMWKAPRLDKPSLLFRVADRLWYDRTRRLLPEYENVLSTLYRADAVSLDFLHDPDGTRVAINSWYERNTSGLITELLEPGDVLNDSLVVLSNAVEFTGAWNRPFLARDTADRTFFLAPGDSVEVPTMYRESTYGYMAAETLQVIEMEYQGGHSMLVLLPRGRYGLNELEANLDIASIGEWLTALRSVNAKVYFPKFRFRRHIQAKAHLKSLGVHEAFDDNADFSGINGAHDLYLRIVPQEAYIEVDETMTRAAAATAALLETRGLSDIMNNAPPDVSSRPSLHLPDYRSEDPEPSPSWAGWPIHAEIRLYQVEKI